MKVAIQSFKNTGHAGRGVGVYGQELLQAIKGVGGVKGIKGFDGIEVVEFADISDVRDKDVDLVHFLVFDLFQKTLPSNISIPTVVTVHDVTPLVFSEHYPPGIKGKLNLFRQKRALKKA